MTPGLAAAIDRVNKSTAARHATGVAGLAAGQVAGVARGGLHSLEGLGFAARLMNPFDPMISAPGDAAWDHVDSTTRAGVSYARSVAKDPQKIVRDVQASARNSFNKLNPRSTPMAATMSGEFGRTLDYGMNQGELAYDVGTAAIGGAGLKGLSGVRALSKEAQIAKRIGQGFSPADAAYLAEDYPKRGMGSHFIPRRWTFPETVAGVPLPKAVAGKRLPKEISDSVFNKLQPPGISRGDMYDLHASVDDRFNVARMQRGALWTRERTGIEPRGLAGTLWYGSPAPLKVAFGGPLALGSLANYDQSLGRPSR